MILAGIATGLMVFAFTAGAAGAQGNGNGNGGGGSGNGNGNLKHELVSATPELDSLVLFGTGLAGAAGYAALRLRARRRSGSSD